MLWMTVHLAIYFSLKSKADAGSAAYKKKPYTFQWLIWIHKRMTNWKQGHASAGAGILCWEREPGGEGGLQGNMDYSLCGVAIYRWEMSTASNQLIGETSTICV